MEELLYLATVKQMHTNLAEDIVYLFIVLQYFFRCTHPHSEMLSVGNGAKR